MLKNSIHRLVFFFNFLLVNIFLYVFENKFFPPDDEMVLSEKERKFMNCEVIIENHRAQDKEQRSTEQVNVLDILILSNYLYHAHVLVFFS